MAKITATDYTIIDTIKLKSSHRKGSSPQKESSLTKDRRKIDMTLRRPMHRGSSKKKYNSIHAPLRDRSGSDTDPLTSSSESDISFLKRQGKPVPMRSSVLEHFDPTRAESKRRRKKKKSKRSKEERSKETRSREERSKDVRPKEERSKEEKTRLPPQQQEDENPNPFAETKQTRLDPDMCLLADGMHLDHNTRTMLAYYDARTLEDFAMMADADFYDLIENAKLMNRALPPLQIRKVEILREWVRDLMDPDSDESEVSTFRRSGSPSRRRKRSRDSDDEAERSIPSDWKLRFRRELPKLKVTLRLRGESLTVYPFQNYLLSLRTLVCGN